MYRELNSKLVKNFDGKITPINFLLCTFVSTTLLWYFVYLPLDSQHRLELVLPPINDSNQSLCYINYVWNKDNERFRFPFMTDADTMKILDKGKNIYFHLTNCIHDGIVEMNPRQACAVESAARINSHLEIFLTFTSPVGFLNKTRMPMIDALLSYENLHIRNIDITKYARTTPVEEWVKEGKLYTSQHMRAHVSDFLRLVSLYRWGGQYLDLDTVMLKNISLLGDNFSGAESDYYVANAVLNMNKHTEIGHKMAELCLNYFRDKYNPNHWSANGPILVTEVLQGICNTKKTAEMHRDRCEGFNVYESDNFYAVSYSIYRQAFDKNPDSFKKIMTLLKNSTLAHMSNAFSADKPIDVDSPVGYGVLAELYCPRVYHTLGKLF